MGAGLRLAEILIRQHPDRAAAVLERLSVANATHVVSSVRLIGVAALMRHLFSRYGRHLQRPVTVDAQSTESMR